MLQIATNYWNATMLQIVEVGWLKLCWCQAEQGPALLLILSLSVNEISYQIFLGLHNISGSLVLDTSFFLNRCCFCNNFFNL